MLGRLESDGILPPFNLVHMPTASWLEIGELFGSTGGSVCLAASAEIEVEILRRAIEGRSIRSL